jgi:hypothetical protein
LKYLGRAPDISLDKIPIEYRNDAKKYCLFCQLTLRRVILKKASQLPLSEFVSISQLIPSLAEAAESSLAFSKLVSKILLRKLLLLFFLLPNRISSCLIILTAANSFHGKA